jgi:DNA-binding response OmpR family regulator
MKTQTIIVLEDDDVLRELIHRSLLTAGYQVISQADSDGIVQLINDYDPALIITDLVMPDHDGMEGIFKVIRQFNIPIIAMSSHEPYLHVAQGIVTSCILKPLNITQLVSEVERILGSAIC